MNLGIPLNTEVEFTVKYITLDTFYGDFPTAYMVWKAWVL